MIDLPSLSAITDR